MTTEFTEDLWDYYTRQGRHDLPWRQPLQNGHFDPYRILVSELMLQQTQVKRVIPKYHEFLMIFPTVQALAAAPLADVLRVWSGLGYNRRAKFLWQAAQITINNRDGKFPHAVKELVTLPGVGINTAGAIAAYAFNQPSLFIETNVRTVYIHHFFSDQSEVSDKVILPLLEQTMDREHPREFYWALMDYGSHVKQSVGNLNRHSSGYAKQSTFNGSRRQVRGGVLRLLGAEPLALSQLEAAIPDERLAAVLDDLVRESLIQRINGMYQL